MGCAKKRWSTVGHMLQTMVPSQTLFPGIIIIATQGRETDPHRYAKLSIFFLDSPKTLLTLV